MVMELTPILLLWLQEILLQVLHILLKSKLLVSEEDGEELQPTTSLSLFLHYKK